MAYTLKTKRLVLREFAVADAPYMLRQLNEPSFIENIADRGVRTLAQAQAYLENGAMASYQQNGFGFWAVLDKQQLQIIGMCGLVKRPNLEHADLGYAFLPEFVGQGFAYEAGHACLAAAKHDFGLQTLLAIVNSDNNASRKLLEKLGFEFTEMRLVYSDEPALCVYQIQL